MGHGPNKLLKEGKSNWSDLIFRFISVSESIESPERYVCLNNSDHLPRIFSLYLFTFLPLSLNLTTIFVSFSEDFRKVNYTSLYLLFSTLNYWFLSLYRNSFNVFTLLAEPEVSSPLPLHQDSVDFSYFGRLYKWHLYLLVEN